MQSVIETLNEIFMQSFENAGYNRELGRVVVSNRPDLCQFQVNGAMSGAKQYRKAPLVIANDVLSNLIPNNVIQNVTTVAPGFININVKDEFLQSYLNGMLTSPTCGFDKTKSPQTVIVDYGGPNVAKPLHVGHLRSAVIGEALKRLNRFYGHNVISDAHLGDWGLQMGLIIHELSLRNPTLCYFDENYTEEYPKEPPFSLKDLDEIYPYASQKSKEDEEYLESARTITQQLQNGRLGYRKLLQHIINVSLQDLKKNYARLDVDFDYWYGESDAQPYIPAMVEKMKQEGYAYLSDGALVVDVKEETDTAPIPPCIILKSNGSAIYETTDLATIVQRKQDFNPQRIIYLADKRQTLHFEQVFRCAKKTGIINKDTDLTFIGFGTVNGSDGKPFKTRSGGTMKLSELLDTIESKVSIKDSDKMSSDELKELSQIIALSAIKYGDLQNPCESNYIFDIDKFASFEGNTGPYILYTMVRIKSILSKINLSASVSGNHFTSFTCETEKDLALSLTKFSHIIKETVSKDAPSILCQYIYELSNKFNAFYHDKKILAETDTTILHSLVSLITLTLNVLDISINLLGFKAPSKM